jgi:hypothetical protein
MSDEKTVAEYVEILHKQGGYAHPMPQKTIQQITEESLKIIADGMGIDFKKDVVNHPPHYTAHPSGVECIQVTEHMNFCLGNAVKYIWRADLKDNAIEDLKKAVWYVNREIERRKALPTATSTKASSSES